MESGTFVLVHGAWGGGYRWSPVADRLRRHGHRVYTPTLTGLGERSHLFNGAINLTTHIEDVVNVFKYEALTDVILAGHSYGGMVVAGVADRVPDQIRALVYIDAFVPRDGDAVLDYFGEEGAHLLERAGAAGGLALEELDDGVGSPGERGEARVLRQPLATFVERIHLTGAADRIPRHLYIFAAANPAPLFRPFYDRVRTEKGWEAVEVASGHRVYEEKSGELVCLLESAL